MSIPLLADYLEDGLEKLDTLRAEPAAKFARS
jgi:hypothetical protein